MKTADCRGTPGRPDADDQYEIVRIEKAKRGCRLCEEYAERHTSRQVAVICCEGACLRGEVARQAATILCHELAPEKTVRVCLGAAFTKDTGQRGLVRNAGRVIVLEGCQVDCASRMMRGVITGLEPEVIDASRLYEFDRQLFGIDEMPAGQVSAHARTVAEKIASQL